MDSDHNTRIENSDSHQLWGWSDLKTRIPLSRSTVWRRIQAGAFPAPLQISPGRVAWRKQDILDWMNLGNQPRSSPASGHTSVIPMPAPGNGPAPATRQQHA